MAKAIVIEKHGGPEVLVMGDVDVPAPGPGEALVEQTAVGLNFIDVYHRTGLYPVKLPAILGMEGAGVVEAIGDSVSEVKVGDRVGYAMAMGSYSQARLIAADRLIPIPEAISDDQAAAMLLQGMTAQYLLRSTYRVQPGETILVHAAAGGVGLILCQWAKHLGVTVIGTVGSPQKAELARAHGCDHTVLYKDEDFVARVREITGGSKVPVVYDSVGQSTFMGSLDCLKPRGMMVSYGQSSGKIPPVDLGVLAAKGSLFLTRPGLATYCARRSDMLASAGELFDVVASGAVRIEIHQTYDLKDLPRAHEDLEARKTTGSTILRP